MSKGDIDFRPLQAGGSRKTISTGGSLSRFRFNPLDITKMATGGEKNDLKIWDINSGEAIFTAKNVVTPQFMALLTPSNAAVFCLLQMKNDKHDLEVPVFITDLHFLDEDSTKVVTSTEFHNVNSFPFFLYLGKKIK